ncbi:MAG TPA: bifunctional hydroxymethylpyrimidine kinase/phosphomethylpyrimidine kinase [Nitrospiria bacterium]|nr:bifunctional hydroxymethylpyrimidine kinase/phosphomethylpyrimidine kinase [Candidatus Manganitrophaceae bacterium]HIL34051.1 bifunctional hydroxymethylpyrimidine kinase/phosphomethylpyrimidine kinase [Candidatus Manganitrophaceae bacterium]
MREKLPQVLTIAGSDPSGGAGIQADIKTIHANGAYALTVLTSVTAQNTVEVASALDLPLKIIEAQVKAIFDDFDVAAVKTGMLSSKGIVKRIALLLRNHKARNLVIDPVMISKSGYALLNPEAVQVIKSDLIPQAILVTPNIHEAETLTGMKIRKVREAEKAAQAIMKLGCGAVLIKGGHLMEAPGCDVLCDGRKTTLLEGEFIKTSNTHGTGCTYASAIATHLALGKPLIEAVREAKAYITEAIRHGLSLGHGHGPTDHFYFLKRPGS